MGPLLAYVPWATSLREFPMHVLHIRRLMTVHVYTPCGHSPQNVFTHKQNLTMLDNSSLTLAVRVFPAQLIWAHCWCTASAYAPCAQHRGATPCAHSPHIAHGAAPCARCPGTFLVCILCGTWLGTLPAHRLCVQSVLAQQGVPVPLSKKLMGHRGRSVRTFCVHILCGSLYTRCVRAFLASSLCITVLKTLLVALCADFA